MSAPPMKDLGPAPVRTMARRSVVSVLTFLMDWGRESSRGVFRAFSLFGREIVIWAIVPALRRVRVVRIDGVGMVMVVLVVMLMRIGVLCWLDLSGYNYMLPY